jgi:hypothetical protein
MLSCRLYSVNRRDNIIMVSVNYVTSWRVNNDFLHSDMLRSSKRLHYTAYNNLVPNGGE